MAATTASCVEINTLDQLKSYESVWRDLFAQSSQPSAFASWEWLYNWWRYFGANAASRDNGRSPLLLIHVHNGDRELVGLIPVYYGIQSGGRARIPVLRMVGDLEPGAESPTEEPVVLLKRGHERDVVAAVRSFLRYEPSGADWSYASLSVPYVEEKNRLNGAIKDVEQKASHLLSLRRVSTAEILDLPESWTLFQKSLSKSLRDNLKYYPRLIARHGHTSVIRVARTPTEVRSAAGPLALLHRRRNTSSPEHPRADHLPEESHRAFLTDCLTSLASRGMAAIYTLEINGKAVAAQSVLEDPEGICVYYSGFDPDWHMYSPLTILATSILQDAIGRGIKRVNLLGEAKPWKVRWGAKPVDRYARLVRVRWNFPNLLRCAAFHCSTSYSNRFAVAPERTPLLGHNVRETKTSGSTI